MRCNFEVECILRTRRFTLSIAIFRKCNLHFILGKCLQPPGMIRVIYVSFQLTPLNSKLQRGSTTVYMRITFFYTRVTSLYQAQVWLTRLTFVRRNVSKFRLTRETTISNGGGGADFFPCKHARCAERDETRGAISTDLRDFFFLARSISARNLYALFVG